MSTYLPTYWNGIGKHQDLYDELYKELIPPQGDAKSERGEILRIVSKLYYDIFNNGGWNFDVLKDMRLKLLALVPQYAVESTKRFIKTPKSKELNNKNYQKFLDKYVDWAVLYVQALGSLEGLEKELP